LCIGGKRPFRPFVRPLDLKSPPFLVSDDGWREPLASSLSLLEALGRTATTRASTAG